MEESRNNRIVITIGLIGFVTLLAFQNCSQAKLDTVENMNGIVPIEAATDENGTLIMTEVLPELDSSAAQE